MRQPEVCKHQVCDHCGGRFGMVTHRWWGNKFCKRACKNAHRRENHHTQSGWVIPRFFTFAGGACLAAVVAVAMLTLLLASANAAPVCAENLITSLGYTVEAFPSATNFLESPLLAETACLVADVQASHGGDQIACILPARACGHRSHGD
jgi:hypothetical protein